VGPLTIQRWKKNFQGLPVLTHTEKADIQCLFTPGQLPQLSKFRPSQRTLDWIACVSFMTSDGQIVSGYEDGSLHLWDTTTGEFLTALEGHRGQVNSIATRGSLIVSGSDDMYVHVWNGNLLQHTLLGHRLRGLVTSVDVSQSGTRIASGSFDDTVRIWDLISDRWEERLILRGHTNSVHSVAISSHGENVVSGSSDKSVRVWDIMKGDVICILNGHAKRINTVAFSPHDGQVISGSDDRTVRLWAVSTGQEQLCLRGHVGAVYSVAFRPDGKNVVSGSADTTVRIWNAETGEQLRVLCGHSGSVLSVAISSDATQIVSGSFDGSIRVWDIVGQRRLVLLKSSVYDLTQNTEPDRSAASDCLLVDGRCGQWTILENGWIVSLESKDDRLMWFKPGTGETQVTDPSNILVISAGGYRSVDFSESWHILGEGWASSYMPV
jgi:WD40 repeat protein